MASTSSTISLKIQISAASIAGSSAASTRPAANTRFIGRASGQKRRNAVRSGTAGAAATSRSVVGRRREGDGEAVEEGAHARRGPGRVARASAPA